MSRRAEHRNSARHFFSHYKRFYLKLFTQDENYAQVNLQPHEYIMVNLIDDYAVANVVSMVEACRQEYDRAGMGLATAALRGLEVTTASGLRVALLTILTLPAPPDEGTKAALQYTAQAIRRAYRVLSAREAQDSLLELARAS